MILPVGGQSASLVALHADDERTRGATGDDPVSYCPVYPITSPVRVTPLSSASGERGWG